jgi:2-C-methyl-D-erythritol 2,4-cyclodiphosphate synthase
MSYRIGIGYDIHLLVQERKLFVGGIEIPYIKGLSGHSDADVLLHAICDALLGACAGGDIGEHFPDTDPQYQGISSVELLKRVDAMVKDKGFVISNLDTVIIAEQPVFSPFKKQIEVKIASVLNVNEGSVNVKAKTNEGLGAIGRGEAIAAYAVVIISKED